MSSFDSALAFADATVLAAVDVPAVVELSRRKPTFLGGHAVVLADGLANPDGWYFPLPVLEFKPRFSGGRVSAVVATSLGRAFDEAVATYDESCLNSAADPEDRDPEIPKPIDTAMLIASIMLRINYLLSDDELTDLLVWRPDDEESEARWGSILDMARGIAPKVLPDGCGLSAMLAIGYQGPLLLEDAVDLAGMAIMLEKTVPPSKWIDELRLQAEGDVFSGFGA